MSYAIGVSVFTFAPQKVAVGKTAVRLKGFPEGNLLPAKAITVQALGTNTEAIFVGDKEVKPEEGSFGGKNQAARGIELAAKATAVFELNDPSQLWINATTAEEGVAVTVLIA